MKVRKKRKEDGRLKFLKRLWTPSEGELSVRRASTQSKSVVSDAIADIRGVDSEGVVGSDRLEQ